MLRMGYTELLIIGFVALLLFGSRLEDIARELGRGVEEFRNGISYPRPLSRREQYEAEKRAEEFANRMDRFGRAVVVTIGIVLVAVLVAYLLRDLDFF